MFLLYFALWIIFNGAITLEICLFGIGVAAVMFAFTCKFMDYSIARERQVLRRFFPLILLLDDLLFQRWGCTIIFLYL